MKTSEEVTALNAFTAQLQKALVELQKKIKDLTDAVAGSDEVPQVVVDAVNALSPAVQAIDDIVPDAAPPTVPPGTGLPPVP